MFVQFLVQLGASVTTFLTYLPAYFKREFIWWLLVVPLTFPFLIYVLSDANVMNWGDDDVVKGLMEVVHPSLLATALVASLLMWAVTRDASLGLIGGISASCLSRELGGQGTSTLLVVGLCAVIVYGDTHRNQIETFLNSRWTKALIALCFISYAGSQLLDRGIIKHSVRLATGDDEWQIRFSSNVEESMETLGGFFLLLAVVALTRSAIPVGRGSTGDEGRTTRDLHG